VCFWLYWFLLFLIFVLVIILYVLRKRRVWALYEKLRNLEELRRHQSDVVLQENLSCALADYWAMDAAQDLHLAEEIADEMKSKEDAQRKSLEDFNSALEVRRKAFVKTLRRNAFNKKLPTDSSNWSVTLLDISEGDQLDAESLLAQIVFILPKPFLPVSTSKAYLKEEVRVALFTMLRKINFEGYDRHVASLVASAVVVWNDGENVLLGGRPFYPAVPLLPFAEVKKTLQTPEDEEEEFRRLKEPSPEVPFKLTYLEVMKLEYSINQGVTLRRQRLDGIKQKPWSIKLTRNLVNTLTIPRVFDALDVSIESRDKNKVVGGNQGVVVRASAKPMEQELAQMGEINEVGT